MEDNFSTHTKIEENLTADEEVFISYSRVDKEFVGKIIRVLKSNGYSVWVDTESITANIHMVIFHCKCY